MMHHDDGVVVFHLCAHCMQQQALCESSRISYYM